MLRIVWTKFSLNKPSASNVMPLATEQLWAQKYSIHKKQWYVCTLYLPNICIFPTFRIKNWRKIDSLITFNIFHLERKVTFLSCVNFCWFCYSNWFELFICIRHSASSWTKTFNIQYTLYIVTLSFCLESHFRQNLIQWITSRIFKLYVNKSILFSSARLRYTICRCRKKMLFTILNWFRNQNSNTKFGVRLFGRSKWQEVLFQMKNLFGFYHFIRLS